MPEVPSFFQDPTSAKTIPFLGETGIALSEGRFLDPNDPRVGFLNDLVALNPEVTQQAVDLASRDTIRNQKRVQQDIINQLTANNQLESSVTGNRLSELAEEFSRDISDINTRFFLADVDRSLQNIGSLFELGIGTTGRASELGLTNQSQRNSFNLQRFQLELQKEALDRAGRSKKGGLTGALTGAGGGALAGATIGSIFPGIGTGVGALIGGGLGALAGGFGQQGTGGDLLQAGATGFGLSRIGLPSGTPPIQGGGGFTGQTPTFFPRATATNTILNSQTAGLSSGDPLLDKFLLLGVN